MQILKDAVYNPAAFSGTHEPTFGKVVSSYFYTALFCSLFFALVLTGMFTYYFPGALEQMRASLGAAMPEDAAITISNKSITVNKPEPFLVDFPKSWARATPEAPTHLLVIDNREPLTADKVIASDTVFYAAQGSIASYDKMAGKVDIQPMRGDFKEVVISNATIRNFLDKLSFWRGEILTGFAIISFVFYFIGAVSVVLILSLFALGTMLLSRLFGMKYTYSLAWKLTVLANIGVLCASTLFFFSPFNPFSLPYAEVALLFIIITLNMFEAKKLHV
jgi:Protein of unknown function (DUF1189)